LLSATLIVFFPLSQAVQYGSQIKAAVYLTQYQQVPVERASQALYDLFGLRMSTGTVQNCIREAARALTPVVEQISQALREAPVVHFDETSMRVVRTLHWLHTAGTDTLSWYGSHRKRGKPALDELGILPGFAGVAVHDGWAPYASYDCEHALCNAHHLRELIYVQERTQQTWAVQMTGLLREACREAKLSAQQVPSRARRGTLPALPAALRRTTGGRQSAQSPTGPRSHPGRSARAHQAKRSLQPALAPGALRRAGVALCHRSSRAVHQQSGRTRYPHAQAQAEGVRLLPGRPWASGVLHHPLVPGEPAKTATLTDGSVEPGIRWQCAFPIALLNNYAAAKKVGAAPHRGNARAARR
jgi:hypothetical protein